MLSPQHWSQERKDPRGTFCITYGDEVILQWDKATFAKTIPLSKLSNIALFCTAPGTMIFRCYQALSTTPDNFPTCFQSQVVTDDEAKEYDGDNEDDHSIGSKLDDPEATPTPSEGETPLPPSEPPPEVNATTALGVDRCTPIPFDLNLDHKPETSIPTRATDEGPDSKTLALALSAGPLAFQKNTVDGGKRGTT